MGWSEIIFIAVVALIVVGPKDLPVLFQSLGKMTAKVRRMARDFSQAMNEAADSTGMKDVAKDMRNMASPKNMGMDALKDAADKFDKWEPPKPSARGPETAKMTEERKAEAAAAQSEFGEAEPPKAAQPAEPEPTKDAT